MVMEALVKSVDLPSCVTRRVVGDVDLSCSSHCSPLRGRVVAVRAFLGEHVARVPRTRVCRELLASGAHTTSADLTLRPSCQWAPYHVPLLKDTLDLDGIRRR